MKRPQEFLTNCERPARRQKQLFSIMDVIAFFERTEWYCSNEKYIIVRYYDDCDNYEYVTSTLMIPVDILFDDTKIDEWIKSKVDKALEEKEQMRKTAEKRQEEKERQEYERLKEKFGK